RRVRCGSLRSVHRRARWLAAIPGAMRDWRAGEPDAHQCLLPMVACRVPRSGGLCRRGRTAASRAASVGSRERILRNRPRADAAAEKFFQGSEYWAAWSQVPDMTPDIDYAVAAIRADHGTVLDVPCGRGRLLRAIRSRWPHCRLFGADVNQQMVQQVRDALP